MDCIEKFVWGIYGGFVVTGLIIFIIISCCVKSKIHICEEEQMLIKRYNKNISKNQHNEKHNITNNSDQLRESFSLFKMLM